MKISPAPFGMLALSAALALGTASLVTPGTAFAISRASSAGGACQPANGGAAWFQFSNNYLTNIGTTDKYIVCHFVIDEDLGGMGAVSSIANLSVGTNSGAVGGQAVCSAQTGYHYYSTTSIMGTNVGAITLGANTYGPIQFNEAALPRTATYDVLTLNCRVPGGWKIGLIQLQTTPGV